MVGVTVFRGGVGAVGVLGALGVIGSLEALGVIGVIENLESLGSLESLESLERYLIYYKTKELDQRCGKCIERGKFNNNKLSRRPSIVDLCEVFGITFRGRNSPLYALYNHFL